MQTIRQLDLILSELADKEHFMFSLGDLRGINPDQTKGAFRVLISRAVKNGLLKRICRGLYLYPKVSFETGLVLYHAAARLRAHEFNYLSLESVLSDTGVISQIPMNWITLMSSGRSNIIDCGAFGHIEFIHTKNIPAALACELTYDFRCHLWRASIKQAVKDMKRTRRNTDLINWETANEFI
ncbi:type IV toxin-antitoxin system AbiEi family antitoxin domain-containing protein [Desulfobacula sp.]|uniref:type IV toxin-antitoxin system AbiEi family antitoxin n=1 Tax=Desulfobacula sp. TaxID=2593537 RepID=UPI0025C2F440|nr:type IV toxin-antitoxin system AbiEi family antitoxin domain-containing protein [Desulfobacula sp.]MBC2705897.1 type IV toxin-antitoxin system AbiEi family antitoxin domain-containing protein [Desulfobacula sp.]